MFLNNLPFLSSYLKNPTPNPSSSLPNSSTKANKVVNLGAVIKSPLDTKDYKAIKLQNGIRVLLVSTCLHELDSGAKSSSFDTSLNNEIRKFNQQYLGLDQKSNEEQLVDTKKLSRKRSSPNCTESEFQEVLLDEIDSNTSSPDQCDYNALPTCPCPRPSPFKKPKLIRCCQGPASICIAVGVGSFHDHPKVYGLAHFVEHVIFLGSQRYPEPNVLFNKVYENGGKANATTFDEHTMFYFSCNSGGFENCLDILVDALVNTNFREDLVKNEIDAIDSEYGISQTNEPTRINEFIRSRAKCKHPMRKFTWGNKETLSHPHLLPIMYEWKAKYYVANNMTTCLQGPYPIEKLEEIAIKYLSQIPSRCSQYNTPTQELLEYGHPFDPQSFNTSYYLAPLTNWTCIYMTWFLDAVFWKDYKTLPLDYLRNMLTHKSDGGLISYLKRERWITESLSFEVTCNCTDDFCRSSFGSLFSITIYLTDTGFNNRDRVVDAVFSYINLLKSTAVSLKAFQEMQQTRANSFHFRNWNELEESGMACAQALHNVPPAYLLTNHCALSLKFDERTIQKCIEQLTPYNMNLLFVCAGNQEFCKEEAWASRIRFQKNPFTRSRYRQLEKMAVFPEFKVPPEGTFLAKDIAPTSTAPTEPCENNNLHKSDKLVITYVSEKILPCFHSRFPSANYEITFGSPHASGNWRVKLGMMEVWINVARDPLAFLMSNKFGDFFSVNDIFSISNEGVTISLSGPSCYLPDVLGLGVHALFTCALNCDEDTFNNVKTDLIRRWANDTFDIQSMSRDMLDHILLTGHSSLFDIKKEISDLSHKEYLQQCRLHKQRMRIKVEMNGSVSKEQIESMIKVLEGIPEYAAGVIPVLRERSTKIPRGVSLLLVQGVHPKYVTSAVINYFQVGIATERNKLMTFVVSRVLKRSFTNQLRTVEQLGYTAHMTKHEQCGTIGLLTTVLTHPSRCTTGYVEQRVEKFFQCFYNIMKKSDNLAKLYGKYFQENPTLLHEMQEFFSSHFLKTGENYKKLSVQVEGFHPNQRLCKKQRMELRGEAEPKDDYDNNQLVYLTLGREYRKTDFNVINNVRDFKSELDLYPAGCS